MEFENGIEIVGFINVNVDCNNRVDYVLNEKIQKSTNNSMTFVSNSFLAKKDLPKQTRDGSCSPVPELNTFNPFQQNSQQYTQERQTNLVPNQSHCLWPKKRLWSETSTQLQDSSKKHKYGGKFSDVNEQPSLKDYSQNQYLPQSFLPTPTVDARIQNITIKKETADSEIFSDHDNKIPTQELPNIKSDLENQISAQGLISIKSDINEYTEPMAETSNNVVNKKKDYFLHHLFQQEPNGCEIPVSLNSEVKQAKGNEYFMSEPGPSNHSQSDHEQDHFDDEGETSDMIEIDDDEDEDINSLFGKNCNSDTTERDKSVKNSYTVYFNKKSPKSPAQRQKEYRARLKTRPPDEFNAWLVSKRFKAKQYRQNVKLNGTEEQKAIIRIRNRERMQKWRRAQAEWKNCTRELIFK